jgi:hypothetical protein
MNMTEHSTKRPPNRIGTFATPRALICRRGVGVRNTRGAGAPSASHTRASLGALVVVVALALSAASALAAAPETPITGHANLATLTATAATLEDGVLNPGAPGEVGEYEYRYRLGETQCEGESATAPEVAAGNEKEAVPPAQLTDLLPDAHYTFCLIVRNLGGEYSLPSTPAHFTTKPAPPTVVSESAPVVAYKDANLAAQIVPNNEETSYTFEYSTQGRTGTGETLQGVIVKIPGASLPPSFEEAAAGPVDLDDALSPGTSYFYRVVASNAAGTTDGKVETFTTQVASSPVSPVATSAPGWSADSVASPTDFSVSKGGALEGDTYEVEVTNAGSESSGCTLVLIEQEKQREKEEEEQGRAPLQRFCNPGSPVVGPVVVRDEVPVGLTVAGVTGEGCALPAGRVVTCIDQNTIAPDQSLHISISVGVNQPEAPGPIVNNVTVSGGGAREVSDREENQIALAAPRFGPSRFDFAIDGAGGAPDTQAGDHPYELRTTIDLDSVIAVKNEVAPVPTSVQDLKDVVVDLPLGFAGSTLAAPECTLAQLSSINLRLGTGGCPSETVVGHITTEPSGPTTSVNSPIWNLVPEHGYPAEFGYVDEHENTHVFYVHVVPTRQGYVLQTVNSEIPQVPISRIVVTFYGDPAKHDDTGHAQVPFFTDPTACGNGPMTATIWMDSWQNPGSYNPDGTPDLEGDPSAWIKDTSTSPAVTGCDELRFTPELEAQPTTHEADTPSGLNFGLTLPQTEDAGVPATPALKDAIVTLPEGMTVDPSAADGLGVCTEAQIGWLGPDGPNGASQPLLNHGLTNFSQDKPECPESSKIGSLELETPLIPGVLHGELFLAAQNENPFSSTLAGYIVVNDPITGVVLKIAGEIKANPTTGRITAAFEENPQLPFSDLRLQFFGGPRAELATPPACGTYTTSSELSPWSIEGEELPATPFDSYVIDEDCATGFSPAFTGGSTNLQAGAYTTFETSFSREDDDQELAGLTVNLPPGLLANVGIVPECGAAEVAAEEHGAPSGGCPQDSQVGTVLAGAGPGPNPVFVSGKVFLTGPYNNGPYGLAVVVSANPGPFHFGNVVVRQSLRINPRTAAVSDVSDPFPTFLDPVGANGQTDGIPIKLRRVDVDIDRPGFTFNPTNCSKLSLAGSISSTQGAVSNLSTPFEVTNCATLKFEPKVAVTTAGKASKANGASLHFDISYPKGAQGSESWFNEARFDLPIQLPARLTTIQKACIATTFESDPESCPAHSLIGQAVVHTQLLPVPLEGPVYFVSYGSAQFPEAVLVLKGDGVTIDLHGETFIAKSGVTSATFKNTPDVPFENIEVTLPTGPFSEFGTNLPHNSYDLCGQKLLMPTLFKASSGLEIKQNTPITVSGCPKTLTTKKKLTAALKACRKDKNKGKRGACEKAARKKYAHASGTAKKR